MLFAVGGHYSKWKKKSFAELGARAGDIIDWTARITGELQSIKILIPTSILAVMSKWTYFKMVRESIYNFKKLEHLLIIPSIPKKCTDL